MSDSNKALKQTVQAIQRALSRDHNITVPYAALRASVLSAQGLNPHAQPRKSKKASKNETAPAEWLTKTVHLVFSDVSAELTLSLDADGLYLVSEDWSFNPGQAELVHLDAQIPSVNRYGLPDYLSNTAKFFDNSYELKLAKDFSTKVKDLGDDSGDIVVLQLRIHPDEWERLLDNVLSYSEALADDVGFWVGQNYRINFETLAPSKMLEWVGRYLESREEAEALETKEEAEALETKPTPYLVGSDEVTLRMEWVWPDEDSGYVSCTVNLKTGVVVIAPRETVHPEAIHLDRVRVYVETPYREDFFPVFYNTAEEPGCWQLREDTLKELREFLDDDDLLPEGA